MISYECVQFFAGRTFWRKSGVVTPSDLSRVEVTQSGRVEMSHDVDICWSVFTEGKGSGKGRKRRRKAVLTWDPKLLYRSYSRGAGIDWV